MTEGEGKGESKRRFWRHGRRKKAKPNEGAVSAGAEEAVKEPVDDAVTEDPEGRSPQQDYEPPALAIDAEPSQEEGAPLKKGRRRSRRRKKPALAEAAPVPGADVPEEALSAPEEESAGSDIESEPVSPHDEAAPTHEVHAHENEPVGHQDETFPSPSEELPPPSLTDESPTSEPIESPVVTPPDLPDEEIAAELPASSDTADQKQGEPGKKRRRRRRRRKGKGGRHAENEAQGADVQTHEAGDESPEGLEDEPHDANFVDIEEPEEFFLDEEEGEEAAEDEGNGPRKVMLIDGMHPEENRVAIVAEGLLDYYEVENQRKKAFKGNIYKGKVVNIAPAIEAAFVEFGGGRHGFLPMNEYCAGALMDCLGTWNEGDKRPPLRPGMEILVQVTKEESSIKGAALTSYISIAGRYMVMMLGMKRYGISKKITGEKERERIRKQMEKLDYPEHLGFIVRTVGASRPLKDLKADLQNLLKLWDRTVAGAQANQTPTLLYEEQDIVVRALRDNYSADVTEVMMNSEATFRKAESFFDVYFPQQKNKLKLYRQKRPLFARFNLEEQVERMIARKVPLASGGHIVIDRTEAIWTIDVNSGRSSRDRDIEDTAFRTNREAAAEVARQMRLRDIGGLIVVDFIDMENKSHNKEIDRILKEGLKKDKAKSDVTSLGKFGLVAISRQRMGISFYDTLLKGCEACAGLGVTLTRDSSVVRMLRCLHDELTRDKKDGPKDILVRVSTDLLDTLINQKRDEITRIERICGGKVTIQADLSLPLSTFAIGAPASSNGGGTGVVR